MAALSVTLPASITNKPPTYRLYMETLDRKFKFGSLIAPLIVEYSGFTAEWAEVERDGRTPYLVYNGHNLYTLDFTMKLAYSNEPDRSIYGGLSQLSQMARSTSIIKLTYGGGFDTRLWRLNDLKIKVLRRHPVTSVPTEAEVQVSLISANDVKLSVGPVSGGKSTTTSSVVKKPVTTSKKVSSSKSSSSKSKSKTKYYTVKSRDTLTSIAIKVYGDARKWRRLADLNKIKNPKTALKVGRKLKV